jgi:hypothetical protein
MNKNLFLRHTVQKQIDLVDNHNQNKDLEKQTNIEIEISIQELIENETKKLLELLDLYEKNLLDKDLSYEYEYKLIKDTSVKEPIINPIIKTMNDIILENNLDNRNDVKVFEEVKESLINLDEIVQNEVINQTDNTDQIEKKQTKKDKKKNNRK